ncbi:MAG: GNAT family N-acetyltransferase [Bacteroidota bacterium]
MRPVIRALEPTDAAIISEAFAQQGWNKPEAQYERYYAEQQEGIRDIIVAEIDGEFAGYLTIMWKSHYIPFSQENIPEVVDFNVLIKFWRMGIGTALMDEAEVRMRQVSSKAGIGFGLTRDYGAAQILYVKRGYIPTGDGMVKNGQIVAYGQQVEVGDELGFYLVKELAPLGKVELE